MCHNDEQPKVWQWICWMLGAAAHAPLPERPWWQSQATAGKTQHPGRGMRMLLSTPQHVNSFHQSRHGGILRDTSWRLDARGVVRCHGTAGWCRHSQASTSAAQNIHSVQQSIDKQTRRLCMPDYNARNDWSAGKLRPGRKGEHHSLSSACKCKIPQKTAWAPPPNCTGSPIICRRIGIQQLGSTWMTWGINKGCSMPGHHVKTSLTHGSYTFCIFLICLARMQTQEILGHILHETLQDNYWQKST